MDSEVLNSITDCKAIKDPNGVVKPCEWWYEILGECRRAAGIECRHGVRGPQQEFTIDDYNYLA